MGNRRLPRVFGYRGKPPRSVAGSDLSNSSEEHLDGKYSHEEDYALKVANSYNNDGSSAAKAAESVAELSLAGISTNGNYYIKPPTATTAQQVFVDFDGTSSGISGGGAWIRIEYSADLYTQSSPWTGTGNSSTTSPASVAAPSLNVPNAWLTALYADSTNTVEVRGVFTSYGKGSVGWTYGGGTHQGVQTFDGGNYRGISTSDSSNLVNSRPSGFSYSFTNINTFNNTGTDPTDANDQTWRRGTIYMRDVSSGFGLIPFKRFYNADVDASGTEARYYPLTTDTYKSYTWVRNDGG